MSSVPRTPDEPRDQPSDDQVTGDQVTGDEPQGEGTQIVDPQVDEAPATPEEPVGTERV